jgi:hypothetical protein
MNMKNLKFNGQNAYAVLAKGLAIIPKTADLLISAIESTDRLTEKRYREIGSSRFEQYTLFSDGVDVLYEILDSALSAVDNLTEKKVEELGNTGFFVRSTKFDRGLKIAGEPLYSLADEFLSVIDYERGVKAISDLTKGQELALYREVRHEIPKLKAEVVPYAEDLDELPINSPNVNLVQLEEKADAYQSRLDQMIKSELPVRKIKHKVVEEPVLSGLEELPWVNAGNLGSEIILVEGLGPVVIKSDSLEERF